MSFLDRYPHKVEERKALILDVLRRRLGPMTRQELEAALGWPEGRLYRCNNKGMDPLMLLIEEGKVAKLQKGSRHVYYSDPDITQMLRRSS